MTTSIALDFGSSNFGIPGLESKFDFIGVPNSFVRCFRGILNRFEATVLYQLLRWNSWENSGVIIHEVKWIYKSVAEMIEDAFEGIKPGKLYRVLKKLVDKELIQREQLNREHLGARRACISENRRYYYSPMMDNIMKCIADTLAQKSAETTENPRFSILENQMCQNEKSDFSFWKNNTNTTNKSVPAHPLPPTPQGDRESTKEHTLISKTSARQEKKVQTNSQNQDLNSTKSQTVEFADVVKRPLRVEQKVNQNISTIKQEVQKVVQVEANEGRRQEAGEIPTHSSLKTAKSEKNQTPKGTKPHQNFDGPWTSLEQFKQFYRALVKALPIVANSRSPEGLAYKIVQQLKKGVPHSYWDDFINGLPIGTSTQQEWEIEPSVPYPMFIEYLAEKLIQGNNSQTREQAIEKALNIASSPKQAIFFWKECKISLGNALSEAQRHRDLGVRALPTPLWTKERPEPTKEEAAIAGNKIQQIHASTQAALEAAKAGVEHAPAKNPQIDGGTEQVGTLPHSTGDNPLESDPWLDEAEDKTNQEQEQEQEQKKPKLSDYATEKVKSLLSKGFGKTQAKSKSKKRYSQPDNWRRQPLRIEGMSVSTINKALQDPILRDELTPQLMLSDYEPIMDEMGRIIRIENKPL